MQLLVQPIYLQLVQPLARDAYKIDPNCMWWRHKPVVQIMKLLLVTYAWQWKPMHKKSTWGSWMNFILQHTQQARIFLSIGARSQTLLMLHKLQNFNYTCHDCQMQDRSQAVVESKTRSSRLLLHLARTMQSSRLLLNLTNPINCLLIYKTWSSCFLLNHTRPNHCLSLNYARPDHLVSY